MSKIPKLRFKEFSGDWEERIVGDIGKVSMCKRILKEQTSPTGDIPFYKIGTFGQEPDAFISKKIFDEFKTKYSFPKQGDVLISAAGTIGRTVVYDGLPAYFQDSNIVWIDNNEALVSNAFLLYCYENTKWNTENTTIARLYNENLRNIPMVIPSIPEQQEIASFLSAVDSKIDQLTRKKELLEQYKKGVMQKIFSQELRFKADDGSEFPEWEENTLGTYIDLLSGFAFKGDDISENTAGIPLLRGINITEGAIRHTVEMDRYYCGEIEKLQKYFVQTHDLVISMDGSKVGKNSALISEQDKGSLLVQRVARIRANINGDIHFIYQIVRSNYFIKYVDMVNTSSGIPHISAEQIKNFPFNFPVKEEQTKIANFLSALDTKIDFVTKQLDEAKNFKKGLLQQMFV